ALPISDLGRARLENGGQSRSLLPVIDGTESREVALSEWYVGEARCGVPLELHTVRAKGWKCTIERRSGAGELYDLVNDPDEMHNMFDEPAGAAWRRIAEAAIRARLETPQPDRLPVVGMA